MICIRVIRVPECIRLRQRVVLSEQTDIRVWCSLLFILKLFRLCLQDGSDFRLGRVFDSEFRFSYVFFLTR